MRRILFWIALPLALGATVPAPAPAQLEDLYEEYLALGGVRGCAHGKSELEAALKDIPADIRAYDPAFETALTGALERRAAGCEAEDARIRSLIPYLAGTTEAADRSPGPAAATVSALSSPPLRSASGDNGSWVWKLFLVLAVSTATAGYALRREGD